MNARFYVWENGQDIKITLRPGESVSWSSGGATDEGWSRDYETWSFDGTFVYNESISDGVDCDGRLTRECQSICHLMDLRKCQPTQRDWTSGEDVAWGPLVPQWRKLERSQRDQFAEAMNY